MEMDQARMRHRGLWRHVRVSYLFTAVACLVTVCLVLAPARLQAADASSIQILSPVNDQALRSNNGAVTVLLAVRPALQAGRQVQLVLNGEPVGPPAEQLRFDLTGLSRGAHQLLARLVDARGQVLSVADPVEFHLLRHSKLFRQERTRPSP